MCDDSGSASDGPVARFGKEHVAILTLAGSIVRAFEAEQCGKARDLLLELKTLLGPHAALEEETLFAELRSQGKLVEEVDRLENEHTAMRQALAAVDGLNDREWELTIRGLLANLKAHIEVEEHDLFPASWQVLSSHGWHQVMEKIDAMDAVVSRS